MKHILQWLLTCDTRVICLWQKESIIKRKLYLSIKVNNASAESITATNYSDKLMPQIIMITLKYVLIVDHFQIDLIGRIVDICLS